MKNEELDKQFAEDIEKAVQLSSADQKVLDNTKKDRDVVERKSLLCKLMRLITYSEKHSTKFTRSRKKRRRAHREHLAHH